MEAGEWARLQASHLALDQRQQLIGQAVIPEAVVGLMKQAWIAHSFDQKLCPRELQILREFDAANGCLPPAPALTG